MDNITNMYYRGNILLMTYEKCSKYEVTNPQDVLDLVVLNICNCPCYTRCVSLLYNVYVLGPMPYIL